MTTSFMAGMALGLAIAMPVGPMGLLCIHRTLVKGVSVGVGTGFGAATVHLGYGVLAAMGSGTVARVWLEDSAALLSLVSALVLFWFAARTFQRSAAASEGASSGPVSFLRAYISAVALGMANPSTILLFAAALPVLADVEDGSMAAPWLVAGTFAGSIAWWVMLVAIVAHFHARAGARALDLGSKASAIALAGLAVTMLLSALGLRLQEG